MSQATDTDAICNELRVNASRRYGTLSPLRYPGGKAALAGLFADLIESLGLRDVTYVEPYAGGAGAGVALLRQGVVSRLVINDIDPAVHAFWYSVKHHNDQFLELLESATLNIAEWRRQKATYKAGHRGDPLTLGFAFFYLNRTNRSGILNAGVIGGQLQEGKYLIDARFNKQTLSNRIKALGDLAQAISVSDLDGRSIIAEHSGDSNTFMYVDPPYVHAGSQLYLNAFDGRDHQALASVMRSVTKAHWLLTYDESALIRRLYRDHFRCWLDLQYSARHVGRAQELLVASQGNAELLRDGISGTQGDNLFSVRQAGASAVD